MIKFLLSLSFIFLLSCSKSGQFQPTTVSVFNPLLDGTYKTTCFPAGDGITHAQIAITATFPTLTLEIGYYRDAGSNTCTTGSRIARLKRFLSIAYGADYTASVTDPVTRAYEANMTVSKIEGTFYNNGTTDYVTEANTGNVGDCDTVTTWVHATPYELTGLDCMGDGTTHATAGTVSYGFIDINDTVNPTLLDISDVEKDAGLDGTTPAKRPVRHMDVGFEKQ